ncbi:hypothetical protein [Moorena producens]|uniref:hypothetical protein n=1 Tax=Moorena producens TaxID=1155739 RepID=UPI001E56BB6B|nr:hypothetical protein [Moorena producens]
MGGTTAVAHGGNHGSRSWGGPPRPRCLPKTALPPQDRTGSPRPRCIALLTCVKLPKVRLLPAPCSLLPAPYFNS